MIHHDDYVIPVEQIDDVDSTKFQEYLRSAIARFPMAFEGVACSENKADEFPELRYIRDMRASKALSHCQRND